MTPGQPRTQLSAAERGETAVIVTSCGCYVTAETVPREDGGVFNHGGDLVERWWVLPVQVTSKDPQEARVYSSQAKAQARLGNSCWGVDIGPKTLASKDGCEDCDDGDAKIGVMS